MRSWPLATRLALVGFVVGMPLLFLAGAEWLRVVAATLLVAAIACGAFAIATPNLLADDPPPDELE